MTREIKVEMNEGMKKVRYPNILRSGGLGPCVAFALYDARTRSGYMAHDLEFHSFEMEKRLKLIKKDYGSIARLQVYVTGNSIWSKDNQDQRDFEMRERELYESFLRKNFVERRTYVDWSPPDIMRELILDTKVPEFRVEDINFDDLEH